MTGESKKVYQPCWYCRSEMIWNNDFSYEDFMMEGDGIVAVLTCTSCGSYAHFYTDLGERDND